MTNQATRTERDSMGELQVPADALYGAQTQRAVNNFRVSGQPMPLEFIRALILVKHAAARANVKLGHLTVPIGSAIEAACSELLAGDFMQHFPVEVYQTGSGTSSNMNANEVIATLATRALGDKVSANDHVNFGQSSNDAVPTAIHVSAALALAQQLLPALDQRVTYLPKIDDGITGGAIQRIDLDCDVAGQLHPHYHRERRHATVLKDTGVTSELSARARDRAATRNIRQPIPADCRDLSSALCCCIESEPLAYEPSGRPSRN